MRREKAFAVALDAPVAVERTPAERWRTALLAAGSSAAVADSFTGLAASVSCDPWKVDGERARGTVTVEDYVDDLLDDLDTLEQALLLQLRTRTPRAALRTNLLLRRRCPGGLDEPGWGAPRPQWPS